MKMTITVHENEPPITLDDAARVNQVISTASEEALAKGLLNIIFLEAGNGNSLTLVVGGDETVLGFTYAHQEPPYYASKGNGERDEPVLTAYLGLKHHTEFPREQVIPMQEGLQAVREFCETGDLPVYVKWTEV